MTHSQEDDEDPNIELARLLRIHIRKRQREHLPRYKTRARVSNKISMYVRKSNPNLLEFRVSLDIVERWYHWMLHHGMGDPPPIGPQQMERLNVKFIPFKRKAVPIIAMRLDDTGDPKPGACLTRMTSAGRKSWMFHTHVMASRMGLNPEGGTIPNCEIYPWPAMRAHLIVLPDTHRVYTRRREDPYELMRQIIDINEPPRFGRNTRDPNYHPERNLEDDPEQSS